MFTHLGDGDVILSDESDDWVASDDGQCHRSKTKPFPKKQF